MARRLMKTLWVAILLFSLIIAALLSFNWQPDRSVDELTQWQLPDSEFIDIGGTQTHVVQSSLCRYRMGKTATKDLTRSDKPLPKVVVLLHGTSSSLQTWDGWSEQLADQYCVIRLDLPGFGLTGPFYDASILYSSDRYTDFVKQVLDKLYVDKATLVGNSLGGKIAWSMAVKYPDSVDKLILIDAVGYPATPKHIPIGFRLAKYPLLDSITTHVLPRSIIKKSLESVYADDSKVTQALVNRYFDLTLRAGNRQALTRRMREFDSDNDAGRIQTISAPTLILWGKQDELIPLDNAYRFKQDIKGSQLVVFNHLGHVPQEEDPLATVKVVKAFLR
ncbi:MAG: alpha/beta hydrolase [Psychrobacter sp.]|nr:alpha/beta hydrolase [Psychrobacter sp.]